MDRKQFKERLGIKRTLVRDAVEPQLPVSTIPATESSTPSECGSESSESTIDISPSSGGAKSFKRLKSKEELMSIQSIICEQVPTVALNERIMGKHFSKFGEVGKMYLNPEKQTAIIHFMDHKSARKAKEKGHLISTKIPPIGAIFYHRKNRNRKSSEMGQGDVPSVLRKKELAADFDDVQNELQSMEEYSSGNAIFQPNTFTNAGEQADILSGTRKRKGDLAKASWIKKLAPNPDLPEAVLSSPMVTTPIAKPIVNVSELLNKMQSQF